MGEVTPLPRPVGPDRRQARCPVLAPATRCHVPAVPGATRTAPARVRPGSPSWSKMKALEDKLTQRSQRRPQWPVHPPHFRTAHATAGAASATRGVAPHVTRRRQSTDDTPHDTAHAPRETTESSSHVTIADAQRRGQAEGASITYPLPYPLPYVSSKCQRNRLARPDL